MCSKVLQTVETMTGICRLISCSYTWIVKKYEGKGVFMTYLVSNDLFVFIAVVLKEYFSLNMLVYMFPENLIVYSIHITVLMCQLHLS